jgi:hypothetical protein
MSKCSVAITRRFPPKFSQVLRLLPPPLLLRLPLSLLLLLLLLLLMLLLLHGSTLTHLPLQLMIILRQCGLQQVLASTAFPKQLYFKPDLRSKYIVAQA